MVFADLVLWGSLPSLAKKDFARKGGDDAPVALESGRHSDPFSPFWLSVWSSALHFP